MEGTETITLSVTAKQKERLAKVVESYTTEADAMERLLNLWDKDNYPRDLSGH